MYTIGEFSRITGLSIKALRLYHEKEILVPGLVDPQTGYRYYNHKNVEQARVVLCLRELEFPLSEIKPLVDAFSDDTQLVETLQNHRDHLHGKLDHYSHIIASLDWIIASEKEALMFYRRKTFEVVEKSVEDQLVAGIRFKGKYSDCSKAFQTIARNLGRWMTGKPLNLYYDAEYKENDADIESCVPIRKAKNVEGIEIKTLPGGRCVSLIHQGPYDQLGQAYEKLIAYVKAKGYEVKIPSREVYLKGPGMIFKGNPKRYLTEIQMMIAE